MQRILPRFLRYLLLAALVAAVAGSLAPAGKAIGDSVVCADSPDVAPPELTVSPGWGLVPGEWVTVVGSGFNANARVRLALAGGGASIVVAEAIGANAHGTFLYERWVPFDNEVTATPGTKTWTATDECGRAASSSNFIIEREIYMLSPANPGATVTVSGRGWGVKTSSQVTITLEDGQGRPIPYARFGPFPVNRFGRFDGQITVPPHARGEITVIATDNNGPWGTGGTGGFSANQTVSAVLRVTTGVVMLTPNPASTGQEITISGTRFPARTPLSELTFDGFNMLPSPPPATDASGSFAVPLTVPPCPQGASCAILGSLSLIRVRVGDVVGLATLDYPKPSIGLSTAAARPGEAITIAGSIFSAYSNVDAISIGSMNVTPTPNPLTDGLGNFTATVVVPTLNPGAYTVTVRTGAGFTATAPITILGADLTLTPSTWHEGEIIMVSGQGFPARMPLSELRFGWVDALPSPAPETDASGSFALPLRVPTCNSGGALCPGALVVHVRVADVVGAASFIIAYPTITLSADSARPGDTVIITGSYFSAFANVDTINFGIAPVLSAPNLRTDGVGDFTAEVIVPSLYPDAHTVTVRTGARFTATAPIRILSEDARPPDEALQALTSRGLLTLAAATPPGGTEFGAYVPGLPGDTLLYVEPNGTLVLTLAEDARVSVSGRPAVDVPANTPTFFALGSDVSVAVIES